MPNNFDFIWFSASSVVTMKYKKLFHSITLTLVTFKQENTFRHDNSCPWPQLAKREHYHLKEENSARNLCNAMNSNWTTDFSDVVYASDWTNYFPNMWKHRSRLWLARTHLRKKVHDMAFMAFIGLYRKLIRGYEFLVVLSRYHNFKKYIYEQNNNSTRVSHFLVHFFASTTTKWIFSHDI